LIDKREKEEGGEFFVLDEEYEVEAG